MTGHDERNTQIRQALQLTYPFVFVDEFQDTTFAQYDFLLSAFHSAGIAITGVGDDMQRIMTWAGTRPDSFERFSADFVGSDLGFTLHNRCISAEGFIWLRHPACGRISVLEDLFCQVTDNGNSIDAI